MTEVIIAGWLTPAFYIFLSVLTVCVAAHGLEIFSSGAANLELPQMEACQRLGDLRKTMEKKLREIERWADKRASEVRACQTPEEAAELLSAVFPKANEEKVKELAARITKAKTTKEARQLLLEAPLLQVADGGIRDLLAGLKQNRDTVPGNDMVAWFKNQGIPSVVLEHILGQEEGSEAAHYPKGASTGRDFLSHEESEFNWRLGASAKIAPIAGMAPTMTGAMAFLGDYSSSLKEGSSLLPLSGLNTALFTTCWGCCLTIVSVVLLTYVMKRKIPRARAMVQKIEIPIKEACDKWRAVVDRSSQLGTWGASHA